MRVIFTPSRLSGTVSAPPSKSCAHRMLICAMLSEGESTVRNVTHSGDIDATLSCISALGRPFEIRGDTVFFPAFSGRLRADAVLPCRESASTLRFMLPIALLYGGAEFIGTERLISRGVEVYEAALAGHAVFNKSAEGIRVSGALRSGVYELPGNVSSQYISGLLFALPLTEGDSIIRIVPPVESGGYIDLTVRTLRQFGVTAERMGMTEYRIPGKGRYKAADCTVEGDWSNAAFLLAANYLGGDVTVTGLDHSGVQPDSICQELFRGLDEPIDVSGCPDLAPILMALAAGTGRGATLTGTGRLRIKESDRGRAMAQELGKMGVETDISDNSLTVRRGGIRHPDRVLCSHNDHRIAMALSILLSVNGGELAGGESTEKSWPEYFAVLKQLGARIESAE